METTIVWLIDAHPLLRSALRAQLEGNGFAVAAEAGTAMEIVRNGEAPSPNLIIMDFAQGADAVASLKSAQPQARTSARSHSSPGAAGAPGEPTGNVRAPRARRSANAHPDFPRRGPGPHPG